LLVIFGTMAHDFTGFTTRRRSALRLESQAPSTEEFDS